MSEAFQLVAMALIGAAAGGAVFAGGHALLAWYAGYEASYVERTGADLYGMFSNLSPRRFLQWSLAAFFLGFSAAFLLLGSYESWFWFGVTLVPSLGVGFGASFLPRVLLKRAAKQRLLRFDLQLLDALMSMSNSLKAGFSIIQAFEAVVQERRDPIAQEFDLFLREIRLGVKFETASENLAKRAPSEDLQIMLLGIETARQTGGNLTEVFDRLATVIRERMRIQGRIRSLTAQGRLQAWAVGLMPFVLAVGVWFIQPDMMRAFVTSFAGVAMIGVMLLFEFVGVLVIRKIVNIDV
ncbi:MAG: type II secretion system F family protein [Verrucomicrobiae bacterium]|nr:type II secretion system F family protein [Verrucomicrobiae bacterium]